ncbi:sensor histidine kinase [Olivibacter sp. CPCC 100613]|uniref:sensor histidine kinase n=1 Tax=Olivibacter sp. CPCC 100613 TaxID=3079931 RepID=UPI002FF50FE2
MITFLISDIPRKPIPIRIKGILTPLDLSFFGILGIILTIVGIFFISRHKNRQRIHRLEREYTELDERYQALRDKTESHELFINETHHRVKNNLQFASSLLNMHIRTSKHPEVKKALHDSAIRLQSMLLVHQKLYTDNLHDTIDLANYTKDLVHYIIKSYNGQEQIQKKINICTAKVKTDVVIPYGLLITELITNSIKYAKKEDENLQITIQVTPKELGYYNLYYSDNGPGISAGINWEQTGTMGLRLLTNLTKQLQGTIHYEFNEASIFNINFRST